MCHRKGLPRTHRFRGKQKWFDGKAEQGRRGRILTGHDISQHLRNFHNDFGNFKRTATKRKRIQCSTEKGVQARFDVDEEYQRVAVLKQMGALWRSSKSRLVTQINEAENNQQRMNLRPKNVPAVEWRKFVKLKTSQEFKVQSDSYKERRRNQIPHSCSRKGMVRLAEEMVRKLSCWCFLLNV
ncbi:hypothetical protein Bca4012_065393 [Brassica carinata]